MQFMQNFWRQLHAHTCTRICVFNFIPRPSFCGRGRIDRQTPLRRCTPLDLFCWAVLPLVRRPYSRHPAPPVRCKIIYNGARSYGYTCATSRILRNDVKRLRFREAVTLLHWRRSSERNERTADIDWPGAKTNRIYGISYPLWFHHKVN